MEQLAIVFFLMTLNLSPSYLTRLVSGSLDVHLGYKTAEFQYLQWKKKKYVNVFYKHRSISTGRLEMFSFNPTGIRTFFSAI